MAKKRVDKRGTRDPLIKIKFLVEGPTEKYYFTDLLKDIGYKIHIDIDEISGGGYFSFTRELQKNKSIYDIVFIVTDLDRTTTHSGEKDRLKELIVLLEKLNLKNNIFLTYKNIETWQKATIPYKVNDLTSELGYTGSSKGKEDIYRRIKEKGGDFRLGITKFKETNLYYNKKDFNKGIIIDENISEIQSNLIYFLEYLQNLKVL